MAAEQTEPTDLNVTEQEAMAIAMDILERLEQAGPEVMRAVVRTLGDEGDFAAFIARQRAAGKTDEEIYRGY